LNVLGVVRQGDTGERVAPATETAGAAGMINIMLTGEETLEREGDPETGTKDTDDPERDATDLAAGGNPRSRRVEAS